MSEYTLSLTILGKDKVSGMFSHIDRSLKSIMNTALGVTVARVFEDIAESIAKVAVQSINAVAYVQVLKLTLEALAARELVQMSGGIKTVGDVMGDAEIKAEGLMRELGRMAILSPYTLEATTNTFRMMVAFGSTTDQAKQLTNGLLNMGAGLGAGNEQIQRMAYNLAQVKLQGKVTALDIRQLALAGLPLLDVLQATGEKFGFVVDSHLDFNKALDSGKITWQDFVDTFEEYAETNFSGASEKLARSLYGLKSTFGDVFALTMPRLLGGAVDEVTAILSRLLDSFLYLYDSPELGQMGEKLAAKVGGWLEPVATFVDDFVTRLEGGASFGDALSDAFEVGFGGTAIGGIAQLFNTIGGYVQFFGQIFQTISPIISGTLGLVQNMFATTLLPILGQVVTAAAPLIELFAVGLATAVEAVVPVLDMLVGTVLPPMIDAFAEVMTILIPIIGAVLPVLADLFSRIVIAIMPLVSTLLPVFAGLFATLVTAMLPLVDTVLIPLVGLIAGLAEIIAPYLAEYLPMVMSFAVQIFEALIPIITTLLPPLIELILQVAEAILPLILMIIPPLGALLVWVAEAIGTYLVPIIVILVEWLQTNLPAAIQWVSDMWNNTLLPAIQAIGDFFSGTLVPIFSTVWTWLQTNIPAAIQVVSDFWNNTLLPALTAVWDYLDKNVLALFRVVADFIATVFNKNLEIFAGWWENYILPAVTKVFDFFKNTVQPISQEIVDFYKDTFGPILEKFANLWLTGVLEILEDDLFPAFKVFKDTWLEGITLSLEGISKVIQDVIGWIEAMIQKLKNAKLPDWLERGSPSPFELTLMGINKDLIEVATKGLPRFESALQIKEVLYPDKFMDNVQGGLANYNGKPNQQPSITIENINNYIQGGYEAIQYSIDQAKGLATL